MNNYNVNDIVEVKISSIVSYGVFVDVDGLYTGLIHISEINGEYIENIDDLFNIGEIKKAKIIGVDEERKHLKLTMKGIYNKNKKTKEIRELKETNLGFELFEEIMPKWIEEKITEMEDKAKNNKKNIKVSKFH